MLGNINTQLVIVKGMVIVTTKGIRDVITAYKVEIRVKSLKKDFTRGIKVKENEEVENHLDKEIMTVMTVYVNYCFINNFAYDKVI